MSRIDSPRRVLIIDDEEDARLVAQLGIALATDWEAHVAGNDEAAACCATWQPEAIVLTPPDDGPGAALDALFADATPGDVAVVLVAASDAAAQDLVGIGNDAVRGVLHKPFDMLTIGGQLAEVLGWRRSN